MASMYREPMGVAFHTRSNLIFYVDRQLRQGRVMKLSHTPCDTATSTAARGSSAIGLRAPVCIALIGTDAYITDEDATYPAHTER